jgi:hypothetical protein
MNEKVLYTTVFSSIVKPLVPEEKDQYLALASLIDIGNFIPNIDTSKNIDLLPIAFNACVVNRVNKNGDVIDASTASEIYQNFINKPINIEHNREKAVGVILTAGFSEFGTDLPLTEDQVKEMKGPFNITLGGVVWRVVNSRLTQLIEESNDITSEHYQKISASWELGFSDYALAVIAGESKNLEDAEIINDLEKVNDLSDNLRSLGGTGKLQDGRCVYRKVVADVVPLGIGLTENPAADVKGVSVKTEIKKENKANISENNSLSKDNNVSIDINNEKKLAHMKINRIEEITNDLLKVVEASAITDFIQDQLKDASEKFVAEKLEKDASIEEANKKFEALSAEYNKVQEELAKISSALKELEAAKVAQEAQDKFNQRMILFDAEFELDNEDREVIATDIKGLNEETFSAYYGKMSKLMKNKKKTAKAEEIKASSEQVSEESVVEKAIENGIQEKETIPASIAAAEPTLLEKYRKAFSIENFEIKK